MFGVSKGRDRNFKNPTDLNVREMFATISKGSRVARRRHPKFMHVAVKMERLSKRGKRKVSG